MGRSEGEELPEFEDGAFEINGGDEEREEKKKLVSEEVLNEIVPRGDVWKHTMRGLVGSALVVPARDFECQEVGFYLFIYDIVGFMVNSVFYSRVVVGCWV